MNKIKKILFYLLVVCMVCTSNFLVLAQSNSLGDTNKLMVASEYDENVCTESGTLLDTVIIHIDSAGNQWIEGEPQPRGWFGDNVLVTLSFFDMGEKNNSHLYEVIMSAKALDEGIYFTKSVLNVKPTGNTSYLSHEIKHNLSDYKAYIGDSIQYGYPLNGNPSNPKATVKCSFTLYNFGSFTTGPDTLTKPIVIN